VYGELILTGSRKANATRDVIGEAMYKHSIPSNLLVYVYDVIA